MNDTPFIGYPVKGASLFLKLHISKGNNFYITSYLKPSIFNRSNILLFRIKHTVSTWAESIE